MELDQTTPIFGDAFGEGARTLGSYTKPPGAIQRRRRGARAFTGLLELPMCPLHAKPDKASAEQGRGNESPECPGWKSWGCVQNLAEKRSQLSGHLHGHVVFTTTVCLGRTPGSLFRLVQFVGACAVDALRTQPPTLECGWVQRVQMNQGFSNQTKAKSCPRMKGLFRGLGHL